MRPDKMRRSAGQAFISTRFFYARRARRAAPIKIERFPTPGAGTYRYIGG